jgi:acylphosphatase
MKKNLEIVVSGRVQGVGYRYFVQLKATENQISGFVRNLPSGEVMVVAEGELSDLETFLDHLKNGPARAVVTKMTVSRSPYTGNWTGFSVKY